jgi:hypothetical protein
LLAFNAGCAAQPAAPADDGWIALQSRLTGCTERHGYDPAATGTLGPHELGTGERAWRACFYAAIEETLARRSTIPEAYQRLIDEDRRMTDAIEAGSLTRAERRQRLEEQVHNLRLSERLNEEIATAQEHERVRRDLERMRQLQEFERLVRPRIVVPLGR